jgi:membrane protein
LLYESVMFASFALPIGWKELSKRTAKETIEDDVLSLAAQQAYYFFFSLFPALLTLIGIASFFPVANLTDEVIRYLGRLAPPDVLTIVNEQLLQISSSGDSGLLTFAFLLTLWSSSGAMVSIITTLNTAYDITEGRSLLKVRAIAVLLTLGLAFFIIVSTALIIVGPPLAEKLAVALQLGPVFEWTWKILQWPVVFALAATGIALIYYYAPDAEQEWVWLTPGAVLATALWILASLGLRLYLSYFGSFNETYGAIGAFMVLLLWLHVTSIAILIGAELNAEIEHASPYGKAPGEKVPGEKMKIGLAAWRDWERRGKADRLARKDPGRDRATSSDSASKRPA